MAGTVTTIDFNCSSIINDFNTFINNSVYLGNNYYVNYTITVYEQNIRVSSQTITVTDNFNTPIEYRPIIKYSFVLLKNVNIGGSILKMKIQ